MDFHQSSAEAWGDKIPFLPLLPRNQTKILLLFPLQGFHLLPPGLQKSCGSHSCLRLFPLRPGLKAAAKYSSGAGLLPLPAWYHQYEGKKLPGSDGYLTVSEVFSGVWHIAEPFH